MNQKILIMVLIGLKLLLNNGVDVIHFVPENMVVN